MMSLRTTLRSLLASGLIVLTTLLASCGPLPPPGQTRANDLRNPQAKVLLDKPTPDPDSLPRPSDEDDSKRPVVEFWDNGNFVGGKPSTLLFAIWRDGKVFRLLNNRTYVGYVTEGELSRLLERLAQAGVESTPFANGLILPDGDSQMIYININDVEIALKHDNTIGVADLDNYRLPANVTRQQMNNFVTIWHRAVAALDDVWPNRLDLITGMKAVPYPNVK